MKEFLYFVAGTIVSILLSPLGASLKNRVQKWRAVRNVKVSQNRRRTLERDLLIAQSYRDDRMSFLVLLGKEILLLNILWVAQSAVSGFVNFGTNAFYGVNSVTDRVLFPADAISGLGNATDGLLTVGILAFILRRGLRVLRLVRHVGDFESYRRSVEGELLALETREGELHARESDVSEATTGISSAE